MRIPLNGQGAHGGVRFHAGGPLQGVEGLRPDAPLASAVGEFVKRLPQKTWVRCVDGR
jgi:hypothetical protein